MPINLKKTASEPKADVSKTYTEKGKVVSEDKVTEPVNGAPVPAAGNQEPLAMVGFSAGYTHNLGDYKSARCDVSLTLPSTMEDISKTYDFAKEWVSKRMDAAVDEIVG